MHDLGRHQGIGTLGPLQVHQYRRFALIKNLHLVFFGPPLDLGNIIQRQLLAAGGGQQVERGEFLHITFTLQAAYFTRGFTFSDGPCRYILALIDDTLADLVQGQAESLDLFCADLDGDFLFRHTTEVHSRNAAIEQFPFKLVSQRAQFLQFTIGG